MIRYIRSHLALKLFLSYIIVILVGVSVIVLATRFTVPQAFYRHMGSNLGPGLVMMPGLRPAKGMITDLFSNFKASFNEALILALLVAGFVAIFISFLLSNSVVTSIRRMTTASQRIAEGHYNERVRTEEEDEFGQLARSFNQMAEKLEQIEIMRRQLIGDVSHELRTPLTAIKGSMEGLMDEVLPANDETFQQIHQEADRLARLVDDLQELSRVESGAYSLEMKSTEINSLVTTVVKRLKPLAIAKSIDLQTAIPADLPPVMADQDRIIQVLSNLVDNAIQYSKEGSSVTIGAKRTLDKVEFRVTDSGIGIPKEHLPFLFTRFYRVDKSRSRQAGGGSGIGLTIAKYLVEAHGGRIWVESQGENRGSSFFFTLNIS